MAASAGILLKRRRVRQGRGGVSGHAHVKEGEGGEGSAQGCRVERRMEEGGPVIRQGAQLAGEGGGLPDVTAREQG
jgi:hypothetical protein